MSKTTTFALLALLGLPATEPGTDVRGGIAEREAPVRVVTTLPVYAAITEAIGGAEVTVTSIADPNEDSHFVRPKPSYALEVRRAELFVTTGLDLELWAPALLDKGGNGRVLEGAQGYVTAYTGITLLDIPAAADRSQGDVHIFGNPHVHTDPLRAIQVGRNITTGLKRIAPDRTAHWEEGLAAFESDIRIRAFGAELVEMLGGETLERLALAGTLHDFLESNEFEGRPLTSYLGGWLAEAASLRGLDVVCYHKNWVYFEDRFGMRCVDFVESKPGIAPTPRHVATLLELMRDEGVGVLLAASYFDRGRVETVAERGGAEAVIVTMQTGGAEDVESYTDLIDLWIDRLTAAASAR
jgi:zinc/manganese transport system substrate-binding protein